MKVPYFSGHLDWKPRRGQDLDAGIRLHRAPKDRHDTQRQPHIIGMLSGFLSHFMIWQWDNQASDIPGPYTRSGGHDAPGSEWAWQDYSEALRKNY